MATSQKLKSRQNAKFFKNYSIVRISFTGVETNTIGWFSKDQILVKFHSFSWRVRFQKSHRQTCRDIITNSHLRLLTVDAFQHLKVSARFQHLLYLDRSKIICSLYTVSDAIRILWQRSSDDIYHRLQNQINRPYEKSSNYLKIKVILLPDSVKVEFWQNKLTWALNTSLSKFVTPLPTSILQRFRKSWDPTMYWTAWFMAWKLQYFNQFYRGNPFWKVISFVRLTTTFKSPRGNQYLYVRFLQLNLALKLSATGDHAKARISSGNKPFNILQYGNSFSSLVSHSSFRRLRTVMEITCRNEEFLRILKIATRCYD